MNNIFLTADNHFGHDNIRKHCARPWNTVEEMDEALIKNWNNLVKHGDLVYILGDFAFRNHGRYIQQLNGKKILILGNHDKMNQDQLRNFTEVHDLLFRVIDNIQVTMCHYAMRTWRSSCYANSISLFGHSHGRMKEYETVWNFDVGVDVWNYAPIPWEVIKDRMYSTKKKFEDLNFAGEAESNVTLARETNLAFLKKHGLAV